MIVITGAAGFIGSVWWKIKPNRRKELILVDDFSVEAKRRTGKINLL